MSFEIKAIENGARAGALQTAHGVIETPIFMPVGTLGTVKGVQFKDLENEIEAQIILGNTYHLYLRPGCDVLQEVGGLHKFIGWNKPILTDSGGYQVYSLSKIRKITQEGVLFQSHIDGSRHLFTPENVIDTQRKIGADIIMAFDECPPWPAEKDYVSKSMKLTHHWLDRCIDHLDKTKPFYGHHQMLFPIVQGGTFADLRHESASIIASKPCEGYAIGGLSVGEPTETMYEIAELVCGILPKEKPRYLMGVGTPANILEGIALGIDMFDCVMPTRNGRNGMIFTSNGIINIKNQKWKTDFSPIDANSPSSIGKTTSKAYLRHLFAANEMLGPILASQLNLAFYLWMVKQAREKITEGSFSKWKSTAIQKFMQRQ